MADKVPASGRHVNVRNNKQASHYDTTIVASETPHNTLTKRLGCQKYCNIELDDSYNVFSDVVKDTA